MESPSSCDSDSTTEDSLSDDEYGLPFCVICLRPYAEMADPLHESAEIAHRRSSAPRHERRNSC